MANTASRWTAFTDTTHSENRTVAIEDVPLGSRVPDQNPRLEDYDFGLRNVDQSTWRQVDLQIRRDDGALIEMQLLRPVEWIDQFGLHVGGEAPLFLEELEVNGRATVTAIRPCCDIEDGEGSVVIGRFITHQVNNLVRVALADGTDFTGTTQHPVWNVGTQEWTALEDLVAGDLLETHSGPAAVAIVDKAHRISDVHNIEVHGHHVYRIADTGVLVHNTTPDCRVDKAKDIIGEATEALGDSAKKAGQKAEESVGDVTDEVLSRLGKDRESARRLARKADEAEKVLGIHGVSVSASNPGTRAVSQARRSKVSNHFPVHDTPTRRDSLHKTVELPKPVTEEVAALFNKIFGRRPKGG